MHPDQLDVKRSGLWVACIFCCSDASGAPATFLLPELSSCCNPRCKAWLSQSEVSCDLPRTTNFHQAIAEDLGTFAPWVFALSKILEILTPSRAWVKPTPDRGKTKRGSVPAQRCVCSAPEPTDPPMAAACGCGHAEAAAPSVARIRLRSRYL
jgi:hypothetical protein